ncbi:MAG: hypothetical protein MJH10_15260 [Epibacterium sp.]|nr:hypothetical protein [Epibacterium sp.]NQX74878.1 hypothetical protein [Epibacterium sp.]
MNVYLLEQDSGDEYESYDSCVVIAESEREAKKIHPKNTEGVIDVIWDDEKLAWVYLEDGLPYNHYNGVFLANWAREPDDVTATLIGSASPPFDSGRQVICTSYNAKWY